MAGNTGGILQYVSKVPTSQPVYGTLAEMSELLKHTVSIHSNKRIAVRCQLPCVLLTSSIGLLTQTEIANLNKHNIINLLKEKLIKIKQCIITSKEHQQFRGRSQLSSCGALRCDLLKCGF